VYAIGVPLYEYRCNACTTVFEVLRPMAERELAAVCPSCESRSSMPLISTVAVRASTGSGSGAVASGGGCCSGGACACGRN
jgi:putative FmdB family regulatory protein